ncbi:hypothetical protein ACA910_012456 [Epithemia clementina (nom. ined.)]
MSFPASAVVDDDDAIITPSFFNEYDALDDDASKLKQAELACQKAEIALSDVRNRLQSTQDEIRSNRSNFDEQTKRIQLVSTHWFYGSTAFQPQLWFRGGCAGKIARAKAKLEKCETEYPDLLAKETQLQERLPEATRVVHEANGVYNACQNADTTRQQMFDQVIERHPSSKLLALQEQSQTLSSRLDRVCGYCQQVRKAKTLCTRARSELNRAERCINQGQRSQEEFHSYQREWQSLPVHRGGGGDNSITTIIKCPGDCGYAKSSWHATHCCNACQYKKKHHDHGTQCERITWEGSEMIRRREEEEEKENKARKRLQTKMEHTQKDAATQWRHAETAFGQASDEIRQAQTTLQILQTQWIQSLSQDDDDFVSIPKSFIETLLDGMSLSPLGLFSSGVLLLHSAESSVSPTGHLTSSSSSISSSSVQALELVRQREDYCNRLYRRISELEKMLSDEKALVQCLEKQTAEDMALEMKQIFEKARLQVTTPFLDGNSCLAPSAPPEPGQDNENVGALYAPSPISPGWLGSELAPPISVSTTRDSPGGINHNNAPAYAAPPPISSCPCMGSNGAQRPPVLVPKAYGGGGDRDGGN